MLIAAVAAVAAVVLAEWLLGRLLHRLRSAFQWLIIERFDENPAVDEEHLVRFLPYGFDPELGWVRRPNTSGLESAKTAGETESERHRRTAFHMNAAGARLNPEHEHLPARISAYGDSYVFARHVDDNETWAWHLSERMGVNVMNFGVGNYGLDQALLRMKREFPAHPTPIVLMGVVPETIVRIVNVWKHYVEYGNYLGVKPRFVLENGVLTLVPNPIDSAEKFRSLEAHLPALRRHDYWYGAKFAHDLLRRPYLLSLFRRPSRTLPLVAALVARAMARRGLLPGTRWETRPWELILARNFEMCRALYNDDEAVQLLESLSREFVSYAKEHGAVPVLCIFPYLHDVRHLRAHGSYYQKAVDRLRKVLPVIDLGPDLAAASDIESLYVTELFGGHFSPEGNRVVAESLFTHLKEAHVV